MRGLFITLEGGEGAGKSTQARLLGTALEARGITVDLTREPGGTSGAEHIRSLLLATDGEGWGPRAEALLFAAARADHVEKRIRPALDAGTWVICDRYLDSNRAYQGGGGGLADKDIVALHQIGSAGLLPDLTLLLEVPAEVSAARLARRDAETSDAIGGRSAQYHARVADRFAELARQEPGRFRKIKADGTVEETHRLILEAIAPLIGDAA
jgi:dTMP kinase